MKLLLILSFGFFSPLFVSNPTPVELPKAAVFEASSPAAKDCTKCIRFRYDGDFTVEMIGTLRSQVNDTLFFKVSDDKKISGSGRLTTTLDTAESPCMITKFNGVVEVVISGEIKDDHIDLRIAPRTAERTSTNSQLWRSCSRREAQAYSFQQDLTVNTKIDLPVPPAKFSEKKINLATQLAGNLHGVITLRVYL